MARLYTREEARRRKVKYQVFAGLFDVLAIAAGVLVIIACILLLSALFNWLAGDVPVTFKSLWDIFMQAVVVPE